MGSPMRDFKNSKTVKKFEPITYVEEKQGVWCGDDAIGEYYKKLAAEHKRVMISNKARAMICR